MGNNPQDLLEERVKRVEDAISLRTPDRVPVVPLMHLFPARYAGITFQEAFDDIGKWLIANRTTIVELEPDMYMSPMAAVFMTHGGCEALGLKQVKLPGHGIGSMYSFQFIEDEYMKADEYEALIKDPSDYAVRTYMPRIYGALEPLRMLPPLKWFLMGYGGAPLIAAAASNPDVVNAFEAMYEAGRHLLKQAAAVGSFIREMTTLGFCSFTGGTTLNSFDLISDMLRGMKGSMLDVFRQPEKLLEAMDVLFPTLVEMAVFGARRTRNPRIYIPLHRGADGFMSPKQFEEYYWPHLKKLFLALIDEGLTPCPFMEGSWNSRLEYLKEVPKGKILAHFDATDVFKAKELLGDRICIQGNVPLTLLQVGTPQQVKDYCRKLIDVVGEGGGLVMDGGGALDDADPELVKVMIEFTKEYGIY